MAVLCRYIVVRNGAELKSFDSKKEAESYDNMLDAAEKLAAFIRQGDLKVALDDAVIEEISIHLAKNANEVLRILKGVKPIEPSALEADAAPEPTAEAAVAGHGAQPEEIGLFSENLRPKKKSGPKKE